jgi:hypothetical protein
MFTLVKASVEFVGLIGGAAPLERPSKTKFPLVSLIIVGIPLLGVVNVFAVVAIGIVPERFDVPSVPTRFGICSVPPLFVRK